jgi:hypothetical protein
VNQPLGFPAIMETLEREKALTPAWWEAMFATLGANAEAEAKSVVEIIV